MAAVPTGKRDARDVGISVGDKVIYATTSGSSGVLVEGVVEGTTPSGRIWVRVERRVNEGRPWAGAAVRVHVAPSSMVVVYELPATERPTHGEQLRKVESDLSARYAEELAEVRAGGEIPSWWDTRENYIAFLEGELRRLARSSS